MASEWGSLSDEKLPKYSSARSKLVEGSADADKVRPRSSRHLAHEPRTRNRWAADDKSISTKRRDKVQDSSRTIALVAENGETD